MIQITGINFINMLTTLINTNTQVPSPTTVIISFEQGGQIDTTQVQGIITDISIDSSDPLGYIVTMKTTHSYFNKPIGTLVSLNTKFINAVGLA